MGGRELRTLRCNLVHACPTSPRLLPHKRSGISILDGSFRTIDQTHMSSTLWRSLLSALNRGSQSACVRSAERRHAVPSVPLDRRSGRGSRRGSDAILSHGPFWKQYLSPWFSLRTH